MDFEEGRIHIQNTVAQSKVVVEKERTKSQKSRTPCRWYFWGGGYCSGSGKIDMEEKTSSRRIRTTIGGFDMAGKKGMKHYPEEMRRKVEGEYKAGAGIGELSQKYGVSRYSVQS